VGRVRTEGRTDCHDGIGRIGSCRQGQQQLQRWTRIIKYSYSTTLAQSQLWPYASRLLHVRRSTRQVSSEFIAQHPSSQLMDPYSTPCSHAISQAPHYPPSHTQTPTSRRRTMHTSRRTSKHPPKPTSTTTHTSRAPHSRPTSAAHPHQCLPRRRTARRNVPRIDHVPIPRRDCSRQGHERSSLRFNGRRPSSRGAGAVGSSLVRGGMGLVPG
jgi:hypothetical protein